MRLSVEVKEIMTKKLFVVKPQDDLKKAALLMKRNRIGSVLVMDKSKLVGILTTSDIVYKSVAGGKGRKAKDIMTKRVVSISPSMKLEDAARLLVEKNIEKLPVKEKGKVLGIVTANDILRVEPALFEVLLERMKISGAPLKREEEQFGQCEVCGNYTDDLLEVNGLWTCRECRE